MPRVSLILLAAVLVGACDRGGERDAEVAVDTLRAGDTSARAAELLAPVRAVSMAAVEFGDLGMQRASRDDIRQYATVVATDHRALVSTLDSAARGWNATLQETAVARDLGNSVRMAHSGLSNLTGGDFDMAFVRAQVESHRQLLDRLDHDLVPEADGTPMLPLLSDTRAMVDAHLARARQLLASVLGEPEPPSAPPAGTPVGPRPVPVRPDTTRPPPDTLLTGTGGS